MSGDLLLLRRLILPRLLLLLRRLLLLVKGLVLGGGLGDLLRLVGEAAPGLGGLDPHLVLISLGLISLATSATSASLATFATWMKANLLTHSRNCSSVVSMLRPLRTADSSFFNEGAPQMVHADILVCELSPLQHTDWCRNTLSSTAQ